MNIIECRVCKRRLLTIGMIACLFGLPSSLVPDAGKKQHDPHVQPQPCLQYSTYLARSSMSVLHITMCNSFCKLVANFCKRE